MRRPVRPAPQTSGAEDFDGEPTIEALAVGPAPARRPSVAARPAVSGRTRSRAPAQIVIANYDFLRHDLRILGLLAPALVVVMIILSIVIH